MKLQETFTFTSYLQPGKPGGCGDVERRADARVRDVHVGLALDEEPRELEPALADGFEERRPVGLVPRVHVRPRLAETV